MSRSFVLLTEFGDNDRVREAGLPAKYSSVQITNIAVQSNGLHTDTHTTEQARVGILAVKALALRFFQSTSALINQLMCSTSEVTTVWRYRN